jgi:arsenate reductase-like glutaredoxin family protein
VSAVVVPADAVDVYWLPYCSTCRLHERTLSDDDLLRLMAEEYTFVIRPVVVRGERAMVGSAKKRLAALIG